MIFKQDGILELDCHQ